MASSKKRVLATIWKDFMRLPLYSKLGLGFLLAFIILTPTVTTYYASAGGNKTIELTPIDDSYVIKTDPNNTNGSDDVLKSDKDRITYMKFNLVPFANQKISAAKLRIYVTNPSTGKQQIKNVVNSNWLEYTMTYRNRPLRGTTVIATISNTKKNQWKEIDLTSAIQSRTGKLWSISVDNQPGSEDSLFFYSKEHNSKRPSLVLEFASSVNPTRIPDPTTTPLPTDTVSATDIPQPTEPPLPTQPPPHGIDLTNWKLTLPVGSSGSPIEIKQPALNSYTIDPWFIHTYEGLRFRAAVNGVTTSGSTYPRSELREMTNNGTANASWSSAIGIHTMILDEAITAVPATKQHVVAGQIHDANDDVIVIRLEMPKLFVDVGGTQETILDQNYTLGKRFRVRFEVQNNKTMIYYNGNTTPSYTLNRNYSGAYFKAGAYTQSNCNKETASGCTNSNYGEVILYNTQVSHQ